MLVDQKYPTDHVFLEEVYSKIFREQGHSILWVMKSKQPLNKITKIEWNQNKGLVLPTKNNILVDYWCLLWDLKKIESKIRKNKFDLVYVRNDPLMGLFARRFSKKHKMPFVFQLSHLKSEETIYFAKHNLYGGRLKNYLVGSISKTLTELVLKKADLIFAISDQMKEYLIEKGMKRNRVRTLPLGTTPGAEEDEGKIRSIVDKYNLKSGKTLIYLGTLIKTRDPFFLFKIIKNLIKEDPEIKLLVVGEGKNPEDMIDYKKYVEVNQLQNNVVFTGRVPRKEVPSYLAAADIGISQFPPNPILKMNSPIKLMEYMNAGLPVVANNYNPEQQNIIKASQGGFCVDYTIKDFCEAILVLIKNQKKGKQMGKNGQIYIRKERNYNKLAQKAEEEMQYKLKKW